MYEVQILVDLCCQCKHPARTKFTLDGLGHAKVSCTPSLRRTGYEYSASMTSSLKLLLTTQVAATRAMLQTQCMRLSQRGALTYQERNGTCHVQQTVRLCDRTG